jgi:hypothetical protein
VKYLTIIVAVTVLLCSTHALNNACAAVAPDAAPLVATQPHLSTETMRRLVKTFKLKLLWNSLGPSSLEYNFVDRDIVYRHGPPIDDTGIYHVSNGMICMQFYAEPLACYFIARDGERLQMISDPSNPGNYGGDVSLVGK